MGKTRRAHYLKENIISKWLYDAGYYRNDIADQLQIGRRNLHSRLRTPARYLTLQQLQMIANMTGKKLSEVIIAVLGISKDHARMWFDENFC